MNLIGNDCVSACFYVKSNVQFNNPFTWSITNYPHMLYIIQNYSNINWKRYSILKSTAKNNTFKICVDGKINIHYVHCVQSESITETLDRGNRYSKNIDLKVVETYAKRTYRMLAQNEEPIFLINTYKDQRHQYSLENVIKLCKLALKYHVILITPHKELLKYKSDKLHIIIDDSLDGQLVRCNNQYEAIKSILVNELKLEL